jgi:hypothetical protein
MTNALGQLVYNEILSSGKHDIDLSKLSNGLYYVKIGDIVSKLVKE